MNRPRRNAGSACSSRRLLMAAAAVIGFIFLINARSALLASCKDDLLAKDRETSEQQTLLLGKLQAELEKEKALISQLASSQQQVQSLEEVNGRLREQLKVVQSGEKPRLPPPTPSLPAAAPKPTPTPDAAAAAAAAAAGSPRRAEQTASPPDAAAPVLPPASDSLPFAGRTVLVIICFNRPDYLQRTLDGVAQYYPQDDVVPILISQDGRQPRVTTVASRFMDKMRASRADVPLLHLHHEQTHLRGDNGYHKLARHFKFALTAAFERGAMRVIILEDDLAIAPDFFSYFAATAPMLDADDSLLCVSAWNDNGICEASKRRCFVSDPRAIVRSDFFPGLGWMMPRRIWAELQPKWPAAYWDDWLREPSQRKERHCLRPEVSRTYTFGERGVSRAQFYSRYLKPIKLNDEAVDFAQEDLSYLSLPAYDEKLRAALSEAKTVTSVSDLRAAAGSHTVKLFYDSLDRGPRSFVTLAKQLGLMADVKAGVPRTAYRTIVQFRQKGTMAYLLGKEP